MAKRVVFAVALCVAWAAAAWADPLVRHAGEWETTLDNGKPVLFCYPADETFDQNVIMRSMAKLPGASCTMGNMSTSGNVTSYSMQCTIGGSTMTSSGTITVTGPDAFTGKVHSHGGAIKMPDGKTMPMQDMDITTVSRRLGPCKPGDRQITH
jgi:hypothetical protein